MFKNNKTYDNSNLRDVQKTFNDGLCSVYQLKERMLGDKIGDFRFSNESVTYQRYLEAEQNNQTISRSIGIPKGTKDVLERMAVKIGEDWYLIDHIQLKTYDHPTWLKMFLERTTIPYETDDE